MKVTCVQMNMVFADPKANFAHAEALLRQAGKETQPDVLVLPETWNTGFFPKERLTELSDRDGIDTRNAFSALADELNCAIVAGSVANRKPDGVYNTSYVFDRNGACIGEYSKTHLFTPMGEDDSFKKGNTLCRFTLDGVSCAVLICYDIRFPELTRTLALKGLDVLFVVSQWPAVRLPHLQLLTAARAVENQMFVICCNSCGTAGETVYGGGSQIVDPWGEILARAGSGEQLICAELDLSIVSGIRSSINIFRDRRPELYQQMEKR